MSETLIKNAQIWQWRGDSDGGFYASWMLIRDGTIKQLGRDPCPEVSASVQVVDANRQWIYPGLIDSHIHVAMMGESLTSIGCDLRLCTSLEELKAKVKATKPMNGFIIGTGWDQDYMGLKRRLNTLDLDVISTEVPVILFRNCLHICSVNTVALRLMGLEEPEFKTEDSYTRDLQTYMKSQLERAKLKLDSVVILGTDGKPTGEIIETGVFEIKKLLYHSYPDELKHQFFKRGLYECLSHGVTTVQSNDFNGAWKVYKSMGDTVPIRVFLTVPFDEVGAYEYDGYKAGSQITFMVSTHRVKLFADGSLGAKTAALRDSYHGECKHHGTLIDPPDVFSAKVARSHRLGYRHEIHVIGDRAAELALDALKQAGVDRSRRPILTHCQILGKDILQKMEDMGAIANIQPSFVTTDALWVSDRLGEETDRYRYSYTWKTLLKNNIICSGGSDAPVENCNPFMGMHASIFRTYPEGETDKPSTKRVFKPEERLSFVEALTLYTKNGAFAGGAETYLGCLQPGFRADLTFVDQPIHLSDFVKVDETWHFLLKVRPTQVWVDGKLVYRSGDTLETVFK